MRYLSSLAVALCAVFLISCGQDDGGPRRVAFVSNGVDPFWNICAAGARDKAEELDIRLDVIFPSGDAADQRQKLEDLLIRGVDGIAVSPVDREGLNDLLNSIAAEIPLITQDADAPDSDRLCFIGIDNYTAGREVGQLVKEAIPDGGKVAIFIGRLEQQNSRDRRQGVIDELLDREADPARFDEIGSVPTGGKYEVVDTRVDNFDIAQAKAGAEDILTTTPDLACMVGLFAYNAPACLEALRGAGQLGKIAVVAFDEQEATLDAMEHGHIFGTVSQNPYQYGAESVRLLEAISRGDRSVIPEGKILRVESTIVRRANLVEFRAALRARVPSLRQNQGDE